MKRLSLIICLLIIGHLAYPFQRRGKKVQSDLTVVSFNIRYGTPGDGINIWNNRKSLIFNIFKKYKGSIIATQEALLRQIDELKEEIPKMDVVYRTRHGDDESGESMAIFYDRKLWKVLDEETFWFSDTPEVPASRSWGNTLPRITTVAVFESKLDGKKIRILNTHLDHRSENSREKSIDLILSKIENYDPSIPTIIVGDLNAQPDDPLLDKIAANFSDSYTGPAVEGCTFHKWDGGRHCDRIDYIFYPKDSGLKLLDSGVDRYSKNGRYPSDHFPIFAKFNFN